jgi:hypothetical protein
VFRVFFVCSVFLSLVSIAKEKSRSMDDMHGDCSNYEMPLGKEIAMWSAEPVTSEKAMQVGQLHSLKLTPQNQVKFPVAPEKFFFKRRFKVCWCLFI